MRGRGLKRNLVEHAIRLSHEKYCSATAMLVQDRRDHQGLRYHRAMSQQKYSRAAPSPRYRRLIEQYQHMHLHGEQHLGIPPESTFPGASLPKQAPGIKRLIKATGAATILDYGCGKGQQYWPRRIADPDEGIEYPDIKSYWGVQSIQCYDPGLPAVQQPARRASSTA